jgi:ABC-type Fe3+/spermidine/putrescine transport system ATPase subunit
MAIADKIALMQAGQLLQVGPPMELYDKPSRAEVAEFFGSVNWLKGTMVHSSCAETPIGRIGIKGSARPGEDVLVGFRPEALTIVEGQSATDANILQGTLRASTFLGDQFLYCVEVRDQSLVGKGRSLPAQKGGTLYLYVDPADVMVFPAGQKTGLNVLEQSAHPG